MRNVFLTGFMGVGKSEVGKPLAKKMNWNFIDIDRLIENEVGKTVTEIFQDEGEDRFRELEARFVLQVCQNEKQVVALGGGAMVKLDSRLRVLGAGEVVYLCAGPTTLLSRLESMPHAQHLFKGVAPQDRMSLVKRMLMEREPMYQTAQWTISTDNKSPETVAHEILVMLGKRS
jgi:shikimate kinase